MERAGSMISLPRRPSLLQEIRSPLSALRRVRVFLIVIWRAVHVRP